MFLRLPCLDVLNWQFPPGFRRQGSLFGGQIKPPIRRQTIYLFCQMIFALACGFSNLHWSQLILNDNKKKERAELFAAFSLPWSYSACSIWT
jgi:hypothetical protein